MKTIKLYEFQEQAILKLLDSTFEKEQTILVKSPTGSGKTIILINFINHYINKVNKNVAFVWLCPGKGDLEVQSMNKMIDYFPQRNIQDLSTALNQGFTAESITFVNWEMVTKTGNRAITDSEKKNLFDRIAEAHRANIDFIIIIDEEHSNNTKKADDIIESLSAKKIIRMSATTQKNPRFEFYEIPEDEVIASGLITKGININEGIIKGESLGNDYDKLILLADYKRKEIFDAYLKIKKDIRPLVLIQFPNANPQTIDNVEKKLESMGYTYSNKMVAKWTADSKINIDNITLPNASPVFLLMKQAITTGWDCPRAKILIKLREGMDQDFEIQTIGRIRRMPEGKHYDITILDTCYVFTYDDKWKSGLVKSCERAYEFQRLFLKDNCREFKLIKQLKNKDEDTGLGDRETLKCVHKFYCDMYSVSKDKEKNQKLFEVNGYIFGNELKSKILQGKYNVISSIGTENSDFIDVTRTVSTHKEGMLFRQSIDQIKKVIGLEWSATHVLLKKLFRKNVISTSKIFNLSTDEFYAFVINNKAKIKEDFKLATGQVYKQSRITFSPKEVEFRIPLQDEFKYDSTAKRVIEFKKSAYKEYSSANCTSIIKSQCEILFEKYCESNPNVEWIYKNGDTGQEYFSIVYLDAFNKQLLFYADYIVKMKDGSTWIIETKGGEIKGEDKNIDIQVQNKFNAFKSYAKNKKINWGFVRYIDTDLYINNTEYSKDMSNSSWVELNKVL